MKKNFITFFIIFIFILMLSFPAITKASANEGLQLWIFTILPALLPYTIISSILLQLNAFSVPCHLIERIIKRKLPKNEFFTIICGCLCGCPIGAKVAADLYRDGKLSKRIAEFLMCAFNNISPSFLINYVFLEIYTPFITLSLSDKWIIYIIMISSTMLSSGISACIGNIHCHNSAQQKHFFKTNSPRDKNTFSKPTFLSIIDKCIFSAFEIQVKIGGYIILFTIITNLFIYTINLSTIHAACFGSILEVTSGLELFLSCQNLTNAMPLYFIPAIITSLTTFGGLCTIFQTKTVIADTDLSIFRYSFSKILAGIISFLLTFVFLCYR